MNSYVLIGYLGDFDSHFDGSLTALHLLVEFELFGHEIKSLSLGMDSGALATAVYVALLQY